MDLTNQQNMYSSELGNFNSDIANYNAQVNQWKQDISEQQQQNEQLASLIENTGLFGMDVVHKIVTSKAFALLTTAVMKSGVLNELKPRLQNVIKQTFGIDLDKESNFAWKKAFEQLDLSKSGEIYKSITTGDSRKFMSIMQDQMVNVVKNNAPEMAQEALKFVGFDVNSPENQKYAEALRNTGITGDDLMSAAQGDMRPLLNRVSPVLKDVVMDKVSSQLNLPKMPESTGEPSPFTKALKTLSIDDVQKALKGDYSGVVEKLSPVVKNYVQDKIQEKYGIDLRSTGESTIDMPLSMNDIKRAMNGDYNGLIDTLKPQVQKVIQQKFKEVTGIDIDAQLAKSPLTIEDLQNISSGNYGPVMRKFTPQVKQYVKNVIKEKLGINVDEFSTDKPSTPFEIDDLKQLASGNYQPLIDKYQPQLEQYAMKKIKENLNVPLDESSIPITLDDVKQLASGNYQPLIDKYKPQVEKYVTQKIKDTFGIPDLDTSQAPLTSSDLKLIMQGKYGTVLSKYEPQLKEYVANKIKSQTGIDINVDDAQTPIDLNDIREIAKGNFKPILSKYEPQIRQHINQQLQDKLGVNVDKYQTDLENMSFNMNDIQSAAKGDYRPILTKLQTSAEKRLGVSQQDLETSFEQAKTQAMQAKQQVESQVTQAKQQVEAGVSQTRERIMQAKQQVETGVQDVKQQVQAGVQDVQQEVQAGVQDVQRQAITGAQQLQQQATSELYSNISDLKTSLRTPVVYVDNPAFDPSTLTDQTDVFRAARQTTASMAQGISENVATTGERLISSLKTAGAGIAGTVGGIAATVGIGMGASKIDNEPARDAVEVGGAAATGAVISGATKVAQGATLGEVASEALSSGAEMGILAGAGLAINEIPNRTGRFAANTALSVGMTGQQLYSGTTNIQNAISSAFSSAPKTAATEAAANTGGEVGAEAGAEAGANVGGEVGTEAAASFAELGTDLAATEIATAPVDAVPIVGEVVQAAVGLAALGASIYFGIKDLFDNSSSTPPPQPSIGEASVQYGIN